MEITYNGKAYHYPASLDEITLQQRIDFDLEYGNELDKVREQISKEENEFLRMDLELEYQMDIAYKSFSFFTGIPIDECKSKMPFSQVVSVYKTSLHLLLEQEQELETELEFEHFWKDEEWEIVAPEVTPLSNITFNEFLVSKETVRQMSQAALGKWIAMLPLCCIYFRKKGESYNDEFMHEGGDRYELMKSLPLSKALQVGFFLSSSMSMYLNTLLYSSLESQEA